MNVKDALARRYSTRGFTGEKITEEEIDAILEAGLQAPTATNRREIHFTVLPGEDARLAAIEEEKNRQRNLQPEKNFYYSAPTVILLSGESGFRWSEIDAGIAVQSMALRATELGLGSLIIGCIHDALHGERAEQFARELAFPKGYDFKIAIAVGHGCAPKAPHSYSAAEQVTR